MSFTPYKPSGFTPYVDPHSDPYGYMKSSVTKTKPKEGNFFERALIDPLKGGAENIKKIVSGVGKDIKNVATDKYEGGGFSKGFQATGNVAKAVLSPITETVSTAVEDVGDKAANIKGVQDFANSKVGEAITKYAGIPTDKFTEWAKQHPEAAKNLSSLGNIAQLGLSVPTSEGVGAGTKTALDTTADLGKAGGKLLKDASGKVVDTVKTGAEKINPPPSPEIVAGKIIQGDIADIPKAQRALSSVDISKVKTYKDLGNILENKIKQIAELQDKAYDTRPRPINLKDLTANGHNFVNDALDQISQFYEKTNNVSGQKAIEALRSKAETQGLNMKEVNNLARLHGKELNAFNANGELASGLTKQAAENTRKGLKSTVRTYMGEEALQGSDAQIADLSRTKKLVNEVSEKVNSLQQKIKQRSALGKAGYYTGKIADFVTGGALKNFVNYFIPRGEGLKTLNALDLEKGLQKSLKVLNKLTDGKISDADFVKQLNDIITKGNPQKLLPSPRDSSTKASVNIPLEGKAGPGDVINPGIKEVKKTPPRTLYQGGKTTTKGYNKPIKEVKP